ncbi:hypothetical protein [Aquiflexum balticum]|nr:hypothetical protein [Aquiflexum balticum]
MKDDSDFLVEWAVWGDLQSKSDLELILLRGHILIDKVLFIALNRKRFQNCDTFSFHSKVKAIETTMFFDKEKHEFIYMPLHELNNLRNKLAHEIDFTFRNGEFEKWSIKILKNLDGTKYTKFTRRTKIINSFSFLAKAILDLS